MLKGALMKRAFLVGRYNRKRQSFVVLRPTRSPIVGPFSLRAVVTVKT